MILCAIGLIALAAIFHASWNIFLQAQDDPLWVARRAVITSAVIWTLPAVAAWLLVGRPAIPGQVWPLIVASAILEVAYFFFLSAAYRRGALTEVYSIARGSAPLLSVLAGVLILREHLSPLQVAGVVLLIGGIWTVRRPRSVSPAMVPALATGIMIAAYSTVDSAAVHQASPWLYGYLVWCLTGLLLWGSECVTLSSSQIVKFARRTGTAGLNLLNPADATVSDISRPSSSSAVPEDDLSDQLPAARSPVASSVPAGVARLWAEGAIVGMLMTAAYLIILVALRIAPLAIVSPLRESAIVLVALWGIRQRDQGRWLALVGAAVIAAGAALVAI